MIYVLATITVAPGKREEFVQAFLQLAPLVRQEEGCLEYVPTIDVDTNISAQGEARPDVVTIVERWESVEALEAHLVAPHMIEFRTRVKGLTLGTSLQIVEPVE